MNPQRRLCLMIACLFSFVVVVVAVNLAANPYGAWPFSLFDPSFRRLDSCERISTPYRLRVEQPATLLVGSSRTLWGIPIEQGMRGEISNAGLPGATLAEIDEVIRLGLRNPHLRRVLWGVEFYAFDPRFEGFRDLPTRRRLEGDLPVMLIETVLSLDALERSRRLLFRAIGGRSQPPPTWLLPVPWPGGAIRERFGAPEPKGLDVMDDNALRQSLRGWVAQYSTYRLSDTQLALFRATVAAVRAAGIDLVIFIPPVSSCDLDAIRQCGALDAFLSWKRSLGSVAPYRDFSGNNELSRVESLFLDPAHIKPVLGQALLHRLQAEECRDCGDLDRLLREADVRVDATTIETHLAGQAATLDGPTGSGSRCPGIVAQILGNNGR
jgi:hypothetical protein